jgi:hypothetical protein
MQAFSKTLKGKWAKSRDEQNPDTNSINPRRPRNMAACSCKKKQKSPSSKFHTSSVSTMAPFCSTTERPSKKGRTDCTRALLNVHLPKPERR